VVVTVAPVQVRHARGLLRLAAFLLVMMVMVTAAGCGVANGRPRGGKPSSGSKLTIAEVIEIAHAAGFKNEQQLVAITSIAIAESSLVVRQRNWHREYGFRPANTALGVTGPASAWDAPRKRQLHSDRGLWQVSSRWWTQYNDAQCDNPSNAARIAFTISKAGTDFRLWDTYKYGAAQKHFDAAYEGWPAVRPAVRSFLAKRRA
jgi:hypothetical protein